MKKLIVYYSLEGNTRYISEIIADELEADLLELKPVKDVTGGGFLKYIVGGFQALTKAKPKLQSIGKDLADYSMIIIGTPVWAGSITPAVRSFLASHPIKEKKLAFFCSYMDNEGRAFKQLKTYLSDNEIISQMGFKKVLSDKKRTENKVKEWLRQIK